MSTEAPDDSVFRQEAVNDSVLSEETLDTPFVIPTATKDKVFLDTHFKIPENNGASGLSSPGLNSPSSTDSDNASISTGTDVGKDFEAKDQADSPKSGADSSGSSSQQSMIVDDSAAPK